MRSPVPRGGGARFRFDRNISGHESSYVPKQPQDAGADELRRAAALRSALREFDARTARITNQNGLTPRQYELLLEVEVIRAARRRVTVGDLVEALASAPASLTELLDRAERARLVSRRTAAHDARVVLVSTTPRGRRRFTAAFRELAEHRHELAHTAQALLAELER